MTAGGDPLEKAREVAVGIARAAGATKVIASDVNPKRLALAAQMGAHVTINAAKADVVPLTSLSPSPEFRLVAESCRAWAETVTRADELTTALRRALEQVDAGRQAVLDVHIS